MKISVIISTYNSPKWLEKVLWGYACQSVQEFEIVVADDGSGDETKKLIDKFQTMTAFSLRHVWHEDNGFRKWEIVNKAIAAASGDYLIFTDGDCIPHSHLVETHMQSAQNGFFLSGGYCKLPMKTSLAIEKENIFSGDIFKIAWLRRNGFHFTPKWLKILGLKWGIQSLLDKTTPAAKTFNGNNSSCFRADALAVNGFDNRILYGGGDREFGYRLEHLGVIPKVIRYSTICLHLDHARGYKSQEVRDKNMAMIDTTQATKSVRTEFGIEQVT
jgi:glycosyltransferase involved in cell wall biosynthesis